MTKRVKLRTDRIIILIAVIIAIVVGIFGIIRDIKLKNTTEYKLEQVGYQKEDVKTILDHTNDAELKIILEHEYHASIPEFLKQKYFIFEHLDRYLRYQNANKKEKPASVISIVNANADVAFYTDIEKTDVSKNYTMLVNKHYQLEMEYKPDDIVPCSLMYAYDENSLREEAYIAFKRLFNDAKKEGHTIIINSSYRDYEWQDHLYESYKKESGLKYADSIAARPGHSEHQTGLAVDIVNGAGKALSSFEKTKEFLWMQAHAHQYGFILRYPEGKELITGYQYEPWHYRYVGVDVASKVHELGITYDEYYAYYIEQ